VILHFATNIQSTITEFSKEIALNFIYINE